MARPFHLLYVACFAAMLLLPLAASFSLDPGHPCRPQDLWQTEDKRARWRSCRADFGHNFVVGPKVHGARLRWTYRLLGLSTTPTAVVGRPDWLFLNGGHFREDRCMAHEPFAPGEKEAWVESLAAWQAYLDQQNAHFVLIVGPDKHTIYPEVLPWQLRATQPAPSRLDALLAALAADPRTRELVVVDPRSALLAAKAEGDLYHRADSHWNERGGLVAYQEIARALRRWYPTLAPLDAKTFRTTCAPSPEGDCTGLLSLDGRDTFNRCTTTWPEQAKGSWHHPLDNKTAWFTTPTHAIDTNRPIRHLLLWRDSFAQAFLSYLLAETAQAHLLQTTDLDVDDVGLQRPDLVALEMVERRLYDGAPPPPGKARGLAFADGFYPRAVDERVGQRWMGQQARLEVATKQARLHRALQLDFRVPPQVAALGPLTYSLGDGPARPIPVTPTGPRLTLDPGAWPQGDGKGVVTLAGPGTMVPATTCQRAYDLRQLTADVRATWVDEEQDPPAPQY